MISNNKILTVSYGTFSCTLEGFDDSFHTMKAIAEYFRDLASDDRYFGAEPPQPDAEMLARIAEREIARRVEARMNEGRIFLSATAPEAAPAAPAAAAPVAPAAPKETEAAPEVAPDMVPETDAVQLQDDNADADMQQSDDIDDAFDHAKAGDMLHTAPDSVAEEETFEDSAPEAFFTDATEDTAESDAEEDEQTTMAVAEAVESTPRDRVIPHADSIAAKLERIRAVVSQADDEDLDDDYSEDEHAEELLSDAIHADENFEDDAFEDDDAQAAEDDALMNAMMAQDEDDDAQDVARESTASEVIAEAAAEASAVLDEDDTMTVAEDEDDGDVAAILARLDGETSEEDADDQVMSGDDTDTDDMNLFDDSDDTDDDDEEIMIVEDEDSAEDAAAPAPRITRIVKVKRADLEAAIAQGNLEEMADDEDDLNATSATANSSSLSEEDEDALLRELADVEAGLIENEADEDEAARAAHVARTAAAKLEDAADDGDVARLMAKTDAEMGEPESARRRDAFAHLRAAVAAKNSDDGIVGDKLAEDALEVRAYQTDLADVVRPRRPELRGTGRDRRPDTQRPAPLKLVAEQRVDAVQPAPLSTPVRPRRVEQPVAVADTGNATHSFAEFAEDMGAHELPDLLEAAAAYLAFVEQRDQFSRPQLMTKVRQVIGTDFSREDGLRSFGQLLRAGKIEKIKGGRFVVSGDIGFRPDQRAAG
ncbi:chemotaxis protein CheA [Sulfitobacter pseudonitzschiae]|uniref:Chemotaxis protein CheA n=1 Tax=Pseudosulfitobacter pseudonitzschiae TaxID=1402135 RepID=A0A9Q2RVK7_9RHOB|nr:chemotaxis protein CheA [Pseudosulfitobacter pseudonitzschiae]MBM2292361.1 chemotaxis protein CheA [Pseudosulfitobacter pseudonitzschiae]MBM2297279.1 chemotaxis protein CheA [Pseudosulfitobacter pseudonitzschiae]MBM2302193.1 chemotaxis protein CheA [Pseudosulfitobacter pseudonitzschiae]MBM2311975.1 chemotaxis protein CheA [Pseudosulfitobacter pseudonitzschiae]MBM2316889.1 chemotaxis protein CheA [Pseudosulfitobacter pseudonitzschiae]